MDARSMIDAATESLPSPFPDGPLRAGVAFLDMTDICGQCSLAGYASRVWRGNTGVADPVGVRAMVLENGHERVAIVSAELLFINRLLSHAVMESLRQRDRSWTRDRVYFSATHTHSAPAGFAGATLEVAGAGGYSRETTLLLAERIAQCILEAAAGLNAVEYAATSIQVEPGLVRNRTVATENGNHWLDVLVFRELDRLHRRTTLMVFGAHPTCRPSKDDRISGDYPGCLCRAVERELGGVCIFLAGAMGSMAPPYGLAEREHLADTLGERLAGYGVGAIRSMDKFARAAPLAVVGFAIGLPTPTIKIDREWRVSPILSGLLLHATAWVHAVRIGDRILIGAPADFSGTLAEEIRNVAPGCTTIVTSFNGDYIGYLIPESYDPLTSYEPRRMSFFGAKAGANFQQTFADLAQRMRR